MNLPANAGCGNLLNQNDLEVEPIICFWDAMHPEGKDESLFKHSLNSTSRNGFDSVWVFSMSNYLRYLRSRKVEEVELEMPEATQRIDWLHRLFALDCNPSGGQ